MKPRYLALCLLATSAAACTAAPPSASSEGVIGYRYHDANHPNSVAQPSPQAIYNATHGVWLWPPATDRRAG